MRPISLRTRLLVAACLPLMALAACSSDKDKEKEALEDAAAKNEAVDVLYKKAYDTFAQKKYKQAIEQFEEVERQHPYSEWAPRSEIMAAYSAYKAAQFDDAVMIVERFVKLHPTHASTPYAYYLKALSYYTQINDVGRDQKTTEEARTALQDVIARYPDSDYAQDAKLKLDLTDDHLAGKEMEIGRYYLRQKEYLSAVNRFTYVVEHYQTTSHTPEALHRLVEAYLRLGVVPEAKKYAAVLGYNYPGTDWYKYSYEMMSGNLSPEEKRGAFDRWLKRGN